MLPAPPKPKQPLVCFSSSSFSLPPVESLFLCSIPFNSHSTRWQAHGSLAKVVGCLRCLVRCPPNRLVRLQCSGRPQAFASVGLVATEYSHDLAQCVDYFGPIPVAKTRKSVGEHFVAALSKPIDDSLSFLSNCNHHSAPVGLDSLAFDQPFASKAVSQLGNRRSRDAERGGEFARRKRRGPEKLERLGLNKRQVHFDNLGLMVIQHQPEQPFYEPVQDHLSRFQSSPLHIL